MNNKRKKLVKEMVGLYGSEHELVKLFTKLCETEANAENDKMLEMIVQCHKENPVKYKRG